MPRPAASWPGSWEGAQAGAFGEPKQRGVSVFDEGRGLGM